ncbi:MAG TPA: gliding motility protein GldL [Cytophagales bacterium]|jgi:gliding motility-associated protein GldL|nr:gliding motility protein GldL [Cytophagales bacterium]
MSSKKGGFTELLYGSIMPKVYGIGAAIVIMGAMFKLLHLPGAGAMLGVGLTTEAIIFFLSAFEPPKHEPDWAKVYPELSDDFEGAGRQRQKQVPGKQDAVSQKLDTVLASGKIGPELIDSLGKGMRNLADTTNKLGQLGDAAEATNEYSNSVKTAASSINKMNSSYTESVNAMVEMAKASQGATQAMAGASNNAKEYHTQVQNVTKNLGALNAIYEMELQDANSHIKAMNKFYSNLTKSMESMSSATEDAEKFKGEINKLTTNLSKLNSIYGGMINAMKA